MNTIAVIGIGMLGKRHLQSVVEEFYNSAQIFAVDVNKEALECIKKEYMDCVTCCEKISCLPHNIDVAIIATNSNIRRIVVEQLLSHAVVKNMILEKVLFQKEEDYFAIAELIKMKNVKTWVNCARRSWDSYKSINALFDSDNNMYINISGGEWGLGCNSVHMLDLIQYFTKSEECIVDVSALDKGIIESKRKGFYEFYGTISGSCGKCKQYQITCLKNTKVPLLINILTDNKRVMIDEAHKKIYICSLDTNWNWEEKEFSGQYQSQLTGKVVQEIINSENCSLSTYSESMKLHLALIRPLMDYFNQEGLEEKLCPIT